MSQNDPLVEKIRPACASLWHSSTQLGSGFLVRPDRVATCYHVVAGRLTDPILVVFHGRRGLIARVEAHNTETDSAVLRLEDAPSDLAPLLLNGGHRTKDEYIAYGYPFSLQTALNRQQCLAQGQALIGYVNEAHATGPFQGATIALHCDSMAAGQGGRPKGVSGGPVVIGERVVGYLSEHIAFDSPSVPPDQRVVANGLLYACPIENIQTLLPPETPAPPRNWCAEEDREVKLLRARIKNPGGAAFLLGPTGVGKTSLIKYLFSSLQNQSHGTLYIDLRNVSASNCSELLRTIAHKMVVELNRQRPGQRGHWSGRVQALWTDQASFPYIAMDEFLEEFCKAPDLQEWLGSKLVVALDHLEQIPVDQLRDLLLNLRTLTDASDRLPFLRIILASAVPLEPSRLMALSLPAIGHWLIDLPDWSKERVLRFFLEAGRTLGDEELQQIQDRLQGNPTLLPVLREGVQTEAMNPLDWLAQHAREAFRRHLDSLIAVPLANRSSHWSILCQIARKPGILQAELSPANGDDTSALLSALEYAHLIRRDNRGGLFVRYAAYLDYIKERCR